MNVELLYNITMLFTCLIFLHGYYVGAHTIELSTLSGLDDSIPIVLDNVECSGSEVRLIDCRSSEGHNCFHFEDVAVHCNRDG